jgi:hypothetical protein
VTITAPPRFSFSQARASSNAIVQLVVVTDVLGPCVLAQGGFEVAGDLVGVMTWRFTLLGAAFGL